MEIWKLQLNNLSIWSWRTPILFYHEQELELGNELQTTYKVLKVK